MYTIGRSVVSCRRRWSLLSVRFAVDAHCLLLPSQLRRFFGRPSPLPLAALSDRRRAAEYASSPCPHLKTFTNPCFGKCAGSSLQASMLLSIMNPTASVRKAVTRVWSVLLIVHILESGRPLVVPPKIGTVNEFSVRETVSSKHFPIA
ncbi:unnamed protein product [Soboliphyme baturini]|uniref:Secreted protein n=1 Tax=Soboliphyme baturini TaxID=241478 RepID=A0A183IEX4_9BILA|nr:unnamed protein product [Soboliphyme baturini]